MFGRPLFDWGRKTGLRWGGGLCLDSLNCGVSSRFGGTFDGIRFFLIGQVDWKIRLVENNSRPVHPETGAFLFLALGVRRK